MNNKLSSNYKEYYTEGYWSKKYINMLTETPSEPKDYPNALLDLNNCLINLSINLSDKKILVIGSISPWIECFLLNKKANIVFTTDINFVNIESDKICFITDNELKDNNFDLIISYSSIEHIGLGRYGDELNVDGDLLYMDKLFSIINDDTILLIGVPVSENYLVNENWHRLYDETRILKLLKGFEILMTSKNGVLNSTIDYSFDNNYKFDWQNQPIIAIKKIKI
jgi:hypothetical protein